MTAHISNIRAIEELGADEPMIRAEARAYYHSTRPGQLWERIATAGLNADALTDPQWLRMAIARNYMGNRRPGLDGDARGPLAANHTEGWVNRFASGILHPITWGLDSFDAAE